MLSDTNITPTYKTFWAESWYRMRHKYLFKNGNFKFPTSCYAGLKFIKYTRRHDDDVATMEEWNFSEVQRESEYKKKWTEEFRRHTREKFSRKCEGNSVRKSCLKENYETYNFSQLQPTNGKYTKMNELECLLEFTKTFPFTTEHSTWYVRLSLAFLSPRFSHFPFSTM